MNHNEIGVIEESLGYSFQNKSLLIQAFTRSSSNSGNGNRNSEVLEFLGDRVIEYYVSKMFFDTPCMKQNDFGFDSKYLEGELTLLKALLVENINLASIIEGFGFEKYLLIGKNDIIQDSYKSDLLESIVGAIAVDSFYDETTLYDLVDYLVMPKYYINSVGFTDYLEFAKWCKLRGIKNLINSKKVVNFTKSIYETTLEFGQYRITESADMKIDSLFKAASAALKKIKANNDDITIKDFLDGLNENNGRTYLDKLKRHDYYTSLTIDEESIGDNEWRVTYHMDGISTWYIDKSKRNANKICSLICINSLISRSFKINVEILPFLEKLGYKRDGR